MMMVAEDDHAEAGAKQRQLERSRGTVSLVEESAATIRCDAM